MIETSNKISLTTINDPACRALLAELAAQTWVMEPRRLEALFGRLAAEQSRPPGSVQIAEPQQAMRIEGATAYIPIKGILLDEVPAIFKWFGITARAYGDIQAEIAAAVADDAVGQIVLEIDSPGGLVSGVLETGQMIRQAAAAKPVTAKITSLAASAAYWLAAQASQITAGETDEIGSIGVYTVYLDSSAAAAAEGLRVIVIRSAPQKGMGIAGAGISDEQIAAVQQTIDELAEIFVREVAAGRKQENKTVSAWADARVHLAPTALVMGLIDEIRRQDAAGPTPTASAKQAKEIDMADEKDKDQVRAETQQAEAQRIAQITAAFPKDPAFALEQIEAGSRLTEAQAAYTGVLTARLAELEAKVQAQGRREAGAEPLTAGDEGAQITPAAGEFIQAARQLARTEKIPLGEAMSRLVAEQPELHEAFLTEAVGRSGKSRITAPVTRVAG